jgi:ABC transporter DrrB family efflux protein
MSTIAHPLDIGPEVRPRRAVLDVVGDTLAVTGRNLRTYLRTPQLVVLSMIQPVIFVLMFRYVFGGAIAVTGGRYVDFLMPGVFIQTVVFGAIGTAVGLATDMQTGLIERFRSLPIARSAVLTGRTITDLIRNVIVVALMCAIGYAVGWRPDGNAGELLGAMALILLFGYAMSWVFATVGLAAGTPEGAQAASFPVLIPLVFASSAFVPVATMPGWLQGWAEHQPISAIIAAMRELTMGGATGSDILTAVAWCVVMVAVGAPFAVRIYGRSV